MHILKIFLFTWFLFLPASALGQNSPNLSVETLRLSIPPSKYVTPYRETSKNQIEKSVTIEQKSFFSSKTMSMSYQLYVPKGYTEKRKYPLIVLLHGANRTGKSVNERWQRMADEVGLVLAAPTSPHPKKIWMVGNELQSYADLTEAVTNEVLNNLSIDKSRVYLFGHSNGGIFATVMPLYKPNLYAAIVVNAGKLPNGAAEQVPHMKAKVPIAFLIGTHDNIFPLQAVRNSAETFAANGHRTTLKIFNRHNHWYYTPAHEINQHALGFMLQHKLSN